MALANIYLRCIYVTFGREIIEYTVTHGLRNIIRFWPTYTQVVSAIQWLPHRKGVVAVACTEAASHSERVTKAGRPASAYILIWNFKVRVVQR